MAYAQITRAQFRALLVERLGAAATVFWRADELNRIIQEALRFWQLCTGFWKARSVIATTPNTLWYALPSSITSGMRVSWQGYPLSPVSAYDMDFSRPAWTSESTTSGGDVPTRPQFWIMGGLNLIALWPSDAIGGSTMTVDGLASTPILASDASYLNIGLDEQSILLDYCQHAASFKEGGAEFNNNEAALKGFLRAAGERSAMLRASATYRKYLGLDKARRSKPIMAGEVETGAR